jgi:hypothetical protein
MSDLGDAVQGVWTLLDILGSFVRKLFRGKRTTLRREWRSHDNSWLGLATIVVMAISGFLVWAFIMI